MTLFKTMDLTAAGMSAQRTRMNVAAMNLANKSTTRSEDGTPYRRRDVVLEATTRNDFGDAFASAMGDEDAMGVRVRDIVESNDEPMLVYDPGHPDADAAGYVAMPNVNPISEMVNLMGAARAYEAGTTVLQTVRSMADQALRIGR